MCLLSDMSKRKTPSLEVSPKRVRTEEELLSQVIEPTVSCVKNWSKKIPFSKEEGYLRKLKPLESDPNLLLRFDEIEYLKTLRSLQDAWGYDCVNYRHTNFELGSHDPRLGTQLQRFTDLLFRNLCRVLIENRRELLEYDVIQTLKGQWSSSQLSNSKLISNSAEFLTSFLDANPNNAMLMKELAELPIFLYSSPRPDFSTYRPTIQLPSKPYTPAFSALVVGARQFLLVADGCWQDAYELGQQFVGSFL